MSSDVKITIFANYYTTAEDYPEKAGVEHEYSREFEVPYCNFSEVHRILTQELGADYCSIRHIFILHSKGAIYQALEKIADLLV